VALLIHLSAFSTGEANMNILWGVCFMQTNTFLLEGYLKRKNNIFSSKYFVFGVYSVRVGLLCQIVYV